MIDSINTIKKLAKQSRLMISQQEGEKFASDLNDFLNYAKKLHQVDTEGIEPTTHIISRYNIFREDEIDSSMNQDLVLKNASDKEEGAFKVPRVVE